MDSTLNELFRNLHALNKAQKKELVTNIIGRCGEQRYWIKLILQLTIAERKCLELALEYRDMGKL